MATITSETPLTSRVPALPSLVETAKQQATRPIGRRPAVRLALSARGFRKDQNSALISAEHHQGAQTERQNDKESSHIETFYKTRYCRYFTQQGNCWKGSECQFAHSQEELRTPPDLTKTRMCAMYRLGCCKMSSSECSFAHSLSDLKATDNFYKTEICSFWANGFCRAGDACRHAHGEEEIRPRLTRMKARVETKSVSVIGSPSSSLSSSTTSQSNGEVTTEKSSSIKSESHKEDISTRDALSSSTAPSSGLASPTQSSSACSREPRDKLLSSASTGFSSVISVASLSNSGDSGELSHSSKIDSSAKQASVTKSSYPSEIGKRCACSCKSPLSSSVGASTPEICSEDFTCSSTTSQTPRMTPAVFVPSPLPCFVPAAPWMYVPSIPASRQLVGIPVDDALNDEGLDREGFCLGIPCFSPHVVTLGLPIGQLKPPTIPSTACASWAYPAPYSIAAFESHIVY